VKWGEWEV